MPKVYTDYRELLENDNLDAVVIATPDYLHYPMTMAALDAGLHVMCEKPLASTAELAREMVARAEEVGVVHMTYFTHLWMPHERHLKQLIEEGYIGKCYDAQFHYRQGWHREAKYDWHYDAKIGNGILGDFGSHMIIAALKFFGEITAVSAHLTAHVDRPGRDGKPMVNANDSAMLTLAFENGAHALIHVSDVAYVGDRNQEQTMILHGEAGTIEVVGDYGHSFEVRGARDGENEIRTIPTPAHLLKGLDVDSPWIDQAPQVFKEQQLGLYLFFDAIIDGKPVEQDFRVGVKAQEVVDAAIESDKKGGWVTLTRGSE
jgi:predicted dehydrogenase